MPDKDEVGGTPAGNGEAPPLLRYDPQAPAQLLVNIPCAPAGSPLATGLQPAPVCLSNNTGEEVSTLAFLPLLIPGAAEALVVPLEGLAGVSITVDAYQECFVSARLVLETEVGPLRLVGRLATVENGPARITGTGEEVPLGTLVVLEAAPFNPEGYLSPLTPRDFRITRQSDGAGIDAVIKATWETGTLCSPYSGPGMSATSNATVPPGDTQVFLTIQPPDPVMEPVPQE